MCWEEEVLKELRGIRRGMEGIERELRLLRVKGLRVTEREEVESDRLESEGEEKKTEDEVGSAREEKDKIERKRKCAVRGEEQGPRIHRGRWKRNERARKGRRVQRSRW